MFLAWLASERVSFYLDSSNFVPDADYIIEDRPWYKEAILREGITYTKPYMEWSTNKMVVSAVKTLTLKDGSRGFVVVDFHLDRLKEIVADLPLQEKGEVFNQPRRCFGLFKEPWFHKHRRNHRS